MQQAIDILALAGRRHRSCQPDMHALKSLVVTSSLVEDARQVEHHVLVGKLLFQCRLIVHIGLDQLEGWMHQEPAVAFPAPGKHSDTMPRTAELTREVPTDEAGTAG